MLAAKQGGLPPQEVTVIKSADIVDGVNKNGVVFYLVEVDDGYHQWTVAKRYSQFMELNTDILKVDTLAEVMAPGTKLPPKNLKLFTSHVSPTFIEDRRCLLESFLKKLVSVPEIASSTALVAWLKADRCERERKREETEELPDDAEVTGVSIPNTRSMKDHVLYQIDICNARKRKSFSKWTVLKRFGQFYDMRKARFLTDHMDEAFVEQRRALLENYLRRMLQIVPVVYNPAFLVFLNAVEKDRF